MIRRPPRSTLFPSPTLFRSQDRQKYTRHNQVLDLLPLVRLALASSLARAVHPAAPGPSACDSRRRPPSPLPVRLCHTPGTEDRKSTRLNSSHSQISYAVFCL